MFVDYCHRNALHPVLTLLDEDPSGSIPFRERKRGRRLLAEITQHLPLPKVIIFGSFVLRGFAAAQFQPVRTAPIPEQVVCHLPTLAIGIVIGLPKIIPMYGLVEGLTIHEQFKTAIIF